MLMPKRKPSQPARGKTRVQTALNTQLYLMINTPRRHQARWPGALGPRRMTSGPLLRLLSRPNTLAKTSLPPRANYLQEVLKTILSKCRGDSIRQRLQHQHTRSQLSRLIAVSQQSQLLTNRDRHVRLRQASHQIEQSEDTPPQSQVHGHLLQLMELVSFEDGHLVIALYKMDPFQPFLPIRLPKRRRQSWWPLQLAKLTTRSLGLIVTPVHSNRPFRALYLAT